MKNPVVCMFRNKLGGWTAEQVDCFGYRPYVTGRTWDEMIERAIAIFGNKFITSADSDDPLED